MMVVALGLAANDVRAVGEPVNGFPNWAERVIHEWINRARVDPQLEMNACGSPCLEHACYSVMPPLTWNEALNRSARFHSDEMVRQGYFAHNSACTLVSNINSLYPTSCNGSASCTCVGGTVACSPTCTGWVQRVQLFGGAPSGEIIASPSNPNQSFYLWLYEPGDTTTCQFTSANGHRWLILKSGGAVGAGVAGYSTGDFGTGSAPTKIPSGSHYPQQAASVAVWANWYDTAGPALATVNVDGTCMSMTLSRGTQTNGAWSATVTGVGSGCHRYYFSFRDAGGTTVTYPTTGSLAIGSGGACPDWDSARPAACDAVATGTPTASPTRTPSHTAVPTPSQTPTPTRNPTTAPLGNDVSGYLTYYSNGLPVPQMSVHATGQTTDTTSSPTDASGYYVLSNLPTEDILVYPANTSGATNGISALDASYVLQSVVGLRQLSAEQRLACDVTGNGALSALDAVLILQYTVGMLSHFPVATACNSDWLFIPNPAPTPGQTLIQPQPGATNCTPGGVAYQPLSASLGEQDFSALLFGDCTGNWQPPGGGGGARSAALASGPAVRAGALRRMPSGRALLPISVERGGPVAAIDVRVVYDPTMLRAVGARPVGRARHASLAFNGREAGVARIALASSEVLGAHGEPVVVVLFEASRRGAVAPSVSAHIDDD